MTDITLRKPGKALLLIISITMLQYCASPKYTGNPDSFYNTIDKKVKGVKEGFWNRYLDANFRPTEDHRKFIYQERIYFRNGEKLNSKYELSKPLQKRQIITPVNIDQLKKPILLNGTYKFLCDNYKHQFIDLCYSDGVLKSITFYKDERITNSTFIVYDHPQYGTISYSMYYQEENVPNDFWLTKLIDHKHWKVIKRSQFPLLDVAKWVSCE